MKQLCLLPLPLMSYLRLVSVFIGRMLIVFQCWSSSLLLPFVFQMCSNQELSNKKVFPTFARTYPQFHFIIPSLQEMLRTFNWSTVAVLYSNDSRRYQETSGELLHALKDSISYKRALKTTQYDKRENKFESIMNTLKKTARSEFL